MTVKDFLNVKKPHFWVSLVIILLLIFAGVVSVLDKEEEPAVVPPEKEIVVEIEDTTEEEKKQRSHENEPKKKPLYIRRFFLWSAIREKNRRPNRESRTGSAVAICSPVCVSAWVRICIYKGVGLVADPVPDRFRG